jgi:hypothetical protein
MRYCGDCEFIITVCNDNDNFDDKLNFNEHGSSPKWTLKVQLNANIEH